MLLPNQIFFIPNNNFIESLANYISDEGFNVVDCGAGVGYLSKLLLDRNINVRAIDIFPREHPLVDVEMINAESFPFTGRNLAVIARPCHNDWVSDTITRAVSLGAQAMYIGLKKNFRYDVAGLGLAHWIFSKDAGADGEYAIIFRNKVDKDNASHVVGGRLAQVQPSALRYRKFHKESKRRLSVTITRYTGIGQHYYVDVREEDNPIWNEKNQVWQSFWDDNDKDGIFLTKRFNTVREAEKYLKGLKMKFKNHIIELPEENIQYYYNKFGD